ncbi:unnamed protein product [Rangifer tarandus platyrhynchus]|uniref:non-specific serine/threonine protein kinase n=1 Tax=Rangifer tarandus platyrhynchus TaxID=3082113 RepID=A0ABN8ZY43_RANTA|nr:unnamed protein product [Rangifer tarandus platyrhynchus]
MREWSVKVPDPRGSKASTPTREGLAEAWPKPCSLGPRNPVVGQRDPGSERPPPLGGRDEGEVCCGFQWVAVVRALRPRKTEPKLSECAPSSPTHRGPGPGAPGSPARRRPEGAAAEWGCPAWEELLMVLATLRGQLFPSEALLPVPRVLLVSQVSRVLPELPAPRVLLVSQVARVLPELPAPRVLLVSQVAPVLLELPVSQTVRSVGHIVLPYEHSMPELPEILSLEGEGPGYHDCRMTPRLHTSTGFLCERRHMQLLDHENIVKVLDVIDTEDSTITVMEYVSGGDMQAYLDDQGHMTEQEAQRLLRQLLSALNHCHERGIVHWDLKPSNLFLDVDHNVKTADFSLNYDYCPGEKLELLYPMFGNIYGSRWMRRSHSSQSEDGLEVTVQNTSSTRDTLGKNSTQNTKSTRDTHGTRDNSGTQDTRGKSSTQDTRSTCDTRGKSSTRDTSSTRDESSTQDTCGKTSTQDTSGTHDTHGKSLGLLLE